MECARPDVLNPSSITAKTVSALPVCLPWNGWNQEGGRIAGWRVWMPVHRLSCQREEPQGFPSPDLRRVLSFGAVN